MPTALFNSIFTGGSRPQLLPFSPRSRAVLATRYVFYRRPHADSCLLSRRPPAFFVRTRANTCGTGSVDLRRCQTTGWSRGLGLEWRAGASAGAALQRALLIGLAMAHEVLGSPVPPFVLRRQNDDRAWSFAVASHKRAVRQRSCAPTGFEFCRYVSMFAQNWPDRLRFWMVC